MDFRRRVALLAALAGVVAAAPAGSIDRSAAGSAPAGGGTKTGGLVAFGSCGELLGYVKSQAVRFVGPWGLGGPVAAGGIALPVGAAPPAREASPQPGVDYSGTNVQEEG